MFTKLIFGIVIFDMIVFGRVRIVIKRFGMVRIIMPEIDLKSPYMNMFWHNKYYQEIYQENKKEILQAKDKSFSCLIGLSS